MSQELGRIERPEAENFSRKRKIYVVPLIFSGEKAPQEYIDRYELYWTQVAEHVKNLEDKIGFSNHIYHESISQGGEDGLKEIEKFHSKTFSMIKERCSQGACLEALEDKELLEEVLDWQRCLLIGLMSEKVSQKVSQFFYESARQRYDYMRRKIDGTLQPDEAGLLFIQERHMIQFPEDIEVFKVSPPALNEIYRWLRDNQSKIEQEKS